MKDRYHIVIIGCGFAGLAAAEILATHRIDVLLLDENIHTGGQLLRKTARHPSFRRRYEQDQLKQFGFKLVNRIQRTDIHMKHNSQVLGIYPERKLLIADGSERVMELKTDFIICATGAREKYLPFKGWTLPGVMSTGAAQILMKSSGILPGCQTLIAGGGPLPLVLAAEILLNKGNVNAVLDQTLSIEKLGIFPLWRHHGRKMLEGAYYLSKLLLARTPLKQGMRIVEAIGKQQLEEVVAAKVDRQGRVITGTETTYRPEALAVGYGFTPNIELPQQAGCSTEYRKEKGGWIVSVDDCMESSCDDIYAVGEITGIAGAKKSYIEGQIAAWSILNKLALAKKHQLQANLALLKRDRKHQVQYGRFLNALCHLPPTSYESIHDATIICRCEEISMGTIRRYLADGFATMGALKKATRCGMGNCQGRICGPIMSDILGAYNRQAPGQVGPPSVRAPIKAVPIGAFLND